MCVCYELVSFVCVCVREMCVCFPQSLAAAGRPVQSSALKLNRSYTKQKNRKPASDLHALYVESKSVQFVNSGTSWSFLSFTFRSLWIDRAAPCWCVNLLNIYLKINKYFWTQLCLANGSIRFSLHLLSHSLSFMFYCFSLSGNTGSWNTTEHFYVRMIKIHLLIKDKYKCRCTWVMKVRVICSDEPVTVVISISCSTLLWALTVAPVKDKFTILKSELKQ